MATFTTITAGKIEFLNSNSEPLPGGAISSNQSVLLTVEGDNVNVWYESDTGIVHTSEKFTGTVHYRIGT
jgi:hypothetical protein